MRVEILAGVSVKRPNFKFVIIMIFMAILVLPMSLDALSKIRGKTYDVELKGYFDKYDKPEFTGESFKDTSYQTAYSNYVANNFKPRGLYIKAYNTLRFNLFNKTHNIVGKDNYIFEYDYVSAELSLDPKNDFSLQENRDKMDDYVYKLTKINEVLESRDKKLLFYISDSKASEYHEYIPKNYLDRKPDGSVRGVDYLCECLEKTDIEWIYTPDLASDLPCESFYATGIHWSRPFEQKANLQVLMKMRELTGKNYRSWELTDLQSSSEPYFRDTDVFNMMNIWNPYFTDTFYQYDSANVIPDNYDQMNALVQGGSFAIGFREDVWEHYPDENIKYINYCEYLMDRDKNVARLNDDWNNAPLAQLVDEADIVVIEMNEAVIANYSNGFVDALYEVLCTEGEGQ